ncbi:hypothetical protein [Shimia marina]|uniref:Dihydroorotate dehydrogenase n=1 Tax=Shimia marina TaxID=321267 RepID=A0A0P1ERS4_9RHOB|nr:hypothetical protein [Shimia marina]CUH53216.1 hypothetical protein SHM7688_02668 [Shimia marina]SFD82253.1 hypothetical protein SAMN04488037_102604 [Shimia marina]
MADKFDDDMLDDLFAAARSDVRVAPDPDLMARVLADAEAVQASWARDDAGACAEASTPSLWQGILSALGGWGSLSGVAMAGVAGVWIGVATGSTLMTNTLGLDLSGTGAQTYLSDLDVSYALELDVEE